MRREWSLTHPTPHQHAGPVCWNTAPAGDGSLSSPEIMLSVTIPVYNFDITPLVQCLYEQLTRAQVPFEIILLDDGSKPRSRRSTERCSSCPASCTRTGEKRRRS